MATLEKELLSARDQLASRTAEYTMAAERFQQAQEELSRLQDQLQQAQVDQREVIDLRQQLSAAQSQLEDLWAQVPTLQTRQVELERLQMERNANGVHVEVPTPPQNALGGSPTGHVSSAPAADGEVAACKRPALPRNRLLEKAQNIRAQLEASSAIKEQVEDLNAQLDETRAEKCRLASELETTAAVAAQLRAQVGELERSLAEVNKAHDELSQAFRQGQTQWEEERQTLLRESQERERASLREAEQRREEEKTRAETDRRQFQELESVRQMQEQECARLRGEIEQLHQDVATLRPERDAAVSRVQVVEEERNRITSERDEVDARHKEAVEGFRADFARLTEAWQQARQQEATAVEQNRAFAQEIEQQRSRSTGHEQTILTLQQAVDRARAETAERERSNNALELEKARAEAERQMWQEQLEAAQRHFDEQTACLESEIEQLREEATAVQQALEIVGLAAE
jgi:chromosome segregation ATPase